MQLTNPPQSQIELWIFWSQLVICWVYLGRNGSNHCPTVQPNPGSLAIHVMASGHRKLSNPSRAAVGCVVFPEVCRFWVAARCQNLRNCHTWYMMSMIMVGEKGSKAQHFWTIKPFNNDHGEYHAANKGLETRPDRIGYTMCVSKLSCCSPLIMDSNDI